MPFFRKIKKRAILHVDTMFGNKGRDCCRHVFLVSLVMYKIQDVVASFRVVQSVQMLQYLYKCYSVFSFTFNT